MAFSSGQDDLIGKAEGINEELDRSVSFDGTAMAGSVISHRHHTLQLGNTPEAKSPPLLLSESWACH